MNDKMQKLVIYYVYRINQILNTTLSVPDPHFMLHIHGTLSVLVVIAHDSAQSDREDHSYNK